MGIAEIACTTPGFETLCTLVGLAGLGEPLSGGGPLSTVFAPTNAAFEALGQDTIDSLVDPANLELLTNILLTHVVEGAVESTDLVCDGELEMVSGEETTTKCDMGSPVAQLGDGNTMDPEFVDVDIAACNGVVHVIDNVILPSR